MGKTRDLSPSASSSASSDAETTTPKVSKVEKTKKRKRAVLPEDEIEVDVNAPEPPSKKAMREAKKAAKRAKEDPEGAAAAVAAAAAAADGEKKRSDYGIWIGNLAFAVDKDMLRVFFTRQAQIPDAEITRLNMPVPQGPAQPGRTKPSNKGFAYVDFATEESLNKAIAMSETLVSGRKVLIKNAKSFEGRPAQATATVNALAGNADSSEAAAAAGDATAKKIGPNGKPIMPPSKRVFVGNLNFDVTRDDLETHFSQAGELEDVFMATFQDTGKCKGYAWVRFAELEAAESAVRGFIWKFDDASDDEEEEEEEEVEETKASGSDSDSDSENEEATEKKKALKTKKPKKQNKRKWFINRLHGRPLRCEFAEDASTRYKKRFGKDRPASETHISDNNGAPITEVDGGDKPQRRSRPKGDADARQEMRRKKFDARKIRPGNALANAPRASAAIVEAAGKKTSFDD